MDNYIVSARKYRPVVWEDVVGQKAITSTLQRAIENDHLAQAFLFCGPRGVGKTTCARILARAINSDENTDSDEDFAFNIFELDAASNNKVEDIRHLTDQVRFAPQKGNYKVYIIDEVHMLSQAAFNAFLKTLEEPPAHAIFILATTEKHKIIPTILSRCQIFDFKRITIADTVEHLKFVAKSEGVTAEEEALHVMAEKADGAMRDALSTFDRLVTFAGNNLTYKDAIANLNILDHDYYFKTTHQILTGDVSSVLLTFDDVLGNGFNGHDFINGLASHFRNLMVSLDPATQNLLETSDSVRNRYREQAQNCSMANLLKALRLTNQVDVQYRGSKNQRLLVELALMRLCAMHAAPSDQVVNPVEKKNNNSQVAATPIPPVAKSETTGATSTASTTQATAPVIVEQPKAERAAKPEETVDKPSQQTPIEEIEPPAVSKPNAVEPEKTEGTKPQQPQPIAKRTPLNVERKRSRAGGMVNIANLGAPSNKDENADEDNTPDSASPFSEDEMREIWKLESEKLFVDKPSLRSTLAKNMPVLKDEKVIVINLENSAQVETFREHGTELLDRVRKKLNNYTITLETPVQKVVHTKQAFTVKDKYQKLAEENPDLDKLRDQLGLDLDY